MGNQTLAYSTEKRRRLGRPIAVALLLNILVLGFIFVAPKLEPFWQLRIPFLRKQAVAMAWVGPAGQIAYCEDPAESKRLSGGKREGREFWTLGAGNQNNEILGYRSHPSVLEGGLWYPESGFQLADQRDMLLFLHGRQARAGAMRLICVRVSNFFPLRNGQAPIFSGWETRGLECTVVTPGTLHGPPQFMRHFWWSDPMFGEMTPKPTRIFYGVPDAVDPSRFSITFQTPAEAKVIVGVLQPDDTIRFTVIPAPDSMQPRSAVH
jgi:hypothetical protein